MTFEESVRTCFTKCANFKGRASRSEYWYWVLFIFLVSLVIKGVGAAIKGIELANFIGDWVGLIVFVVATVMPNIAVGVRRLHDINKSGWWWFLSLLPVIGDIIMLVWACKKGDDKANQYGELSTK